MAGLKKIISGIKAKVKQNKEAKEKDNEWKQSIRDEAKIEAREEAKDELKKRFKEQEKLHEEKVDLTQKTWHLKPDPNEVGIAQGWASPTLVMAQDGNRPDQIRRTELTRLLLQDCSSCHGMRLDGGTAPPLTVQGLKDRPQESLVATITKGRHGTPMPPWAAALTESEAIWMIERLKEGGIDVQR